MPEGSGSIQVVIRTDASAQIGTGHLIRCISLAAALRNVGAKVEFLTRCADEKLLGWILESGFEVSILGTSASEGTAPATRYEDWLGVPWQVDSEQTRRSLGSKSVDWLVVDHYALNEPWEREVRAGCKAMLVIDDLIERRHFCDLLVDQNLQLQDAQPRRRLAIDDAEVLAGPRYAMLSAAFCAARKKDFTRNYACPRRLVVFFGGSDPSNETGKALAGLEKLPHGSFDVDVVAGTLNHNLSGLEAQCRRLNVRLHRGADMASLYASADVAVGAPGTSSWERMCLGIPSLLVSIAENQERVGRALDEAGCAFYLGRSCEMTADEYAGVLGSLRYLRGELERQGKRGMELVDGRGATRVASRMARWWLSVREATGDDSQNIFVWRNSEATRVWSFDQAPISFENHDEWMRKTLTNPARALLIGEDRGEPIGVVRFDCNGADATVSIFLKPDRIGKGIGPALLKNAGRWLIDHRPEVARIFADVVEGNRASESLFREAGYRVFSTRYVLTHRGKEDPECL